jgi:hypothetical protein
MHGEYEDRSHEDKEEVASGGLIGHRAFSHNFALSFVCGAANSIRMPIRQSLKKSAKDGISHKGG